MLAKPPATVTAPADAFATPTIALAAAAVTLAAAAVALAAAALVATCTTSPARPIASQAQRNRYLELNSQKLFRLRVRRRQLGQLLQLTRSGL